jgi:two-component system LytT family response regulator
MNQYPAIIIDDERNNRLAVSKLLEVYCPEIVVVGTAASAREGRQLLESQVVDFIFLDINMPGEDGFEFLDSIEKDIYSVIFITAYEDYAIRAFKVNAIDYLLKPVDPDELRFAVAKAIHARQARQQASDTRIVYNESLENLKAQMLTDSPDISKITIPDKNGFRIIHIRDIIYLEADTSYTVFHLADSEKIMASHSLAEYERLMHHADFFRIHKSYLINMNYLKGYNSNEGYFAEMSDGTSLAISRRKLAEFRDAVSRFSNSVP